MTSFLAGTSVAIIGGGPSGLASAKSALECGLTPTVFEKGPTIGGLWKPKSGSTWDTMRTNLSYHTCIFSDFPWKSGTQDFPNQSEVNEYLCDYAETFHILPHLQLNSEVQKIIRADSQWIVEWANNEECLSAAFDYVIICSGVFSKAFIPAIEGLETFPGEVLHAKDYKTSEPFKDKTVVVIGNAFSGCEISADLATTTKSVINVIRRPVWIMPRYLPISSDQNIKVPLDLVFYSRAGDARSHGVALEDINSRKHGWFRSLCGQQETICPDLAITSPLTSPAFVSISDTYLDLVQSSQISVKIGSIQKIDGNSLHFEDGSFLNADTLLFCTGYKTGLPFFEQEILDVIGFQPDDQLQPLLLHKSVFHPQLPGMAFVGLYRGPFFGVMELQARWACLAFSQIIPYPTLEDMDKGLQVELEVRERLPRPQFPKGNYVAFSDSLAKECGVLPEFEIMKLDNPTLFQMLWAGPFSPASFRLVGHGSNPEVAMQLIEDINNINK